MGNLRRAQLERMVEPAHVEDRYALSIVFAIGVVLALIGITHILLSKPHREHRPEQPSAVRCKP